MTDRLEIKGYRDIPDRYLKETEVREFIRYASPKEKALLVALGRSDRVLTERDGNPRERLSPVLTQNSIKEIVESLSDEDYQTYLKWVRVYPTLSEFRFYYRNLYNAFMSRLREVEVYLTNLRAMDIEERRLNTIFDQLGVKNRDKEITLLDTLFLYDHIPHGEIWYNGNMRIVVEADKKYKMEAERKTLLLSAYLRDLKGLTLAIEKWIKNRKVSAMTPRELSEMISEVKHFSEREIFEYFSEEAISSDRDSGVNISDNRVGFDTLLPTYRDIRIDKEEIDEWTIKLKEIEDEQKKNY